NNNNNNNDDGDNESDKDEDDIPWHEGPDPILDTIREVRPSSFPLQNNNLANLDPETRTLRIFGDIAQLRTQVISTEKSPSPASQLGPSIKDQRTEEPKTEGQ